MRLQLNIKNFVLTIGLAFSAIIFAVVFTQLPTKLAILFTLTIFGFAFLILCIIKPKVGFFTAFVLPFIVFELQRYLRVDFIPIGLIIQGIFFYLLLVLLFKKKYELDQNYSFLKTPITFVLLAILIYLFIQAFNPNMHSIQGWLVAIRMIISIFIIYISTLFFIKDLKFVKQFTYAWLLMALISAVYACYQEWFGLPDHVLHYVNSDPLRYALIFILGKYRKFSLLNDPAAFGVFMASTSIVAFIFAARAQRTKERILYSFMTLFLILAMGYSGTRTSYAMLIGGVILYSLMTINNRRTLFLIIASTLFFIVLLFGPIYGNSTINRFRSTFNSDDASLNVRDINRQYIQPYIYANPLGGGVMTVGVGGEKYNPNHVLAGFPPDSGYLQDALEIGWLGIVLTVLMFYLAMRTGIKYFYRSENRDIKTIYLAFTCFVFTLAIANYAQKATLGIPMILVFFPVLAVLSKLYLYDKKNQ